MSGSDPAVRLRAELVAGLRRRAELSDPRIEAAIGQVPRHVFVPAVTLQEAYADQAIATRYADGVPVSAASQPAIVATMLAQLQPPPGGTVLEIGAGTGYNAALLAHLVGPSGRVVTIDIDEQTAAQARDHLTAAGVANVEVICADGALGWPGGAPYDGIIVTAGVSDLAPAWVDQLAPAGRLVAPLSIRGVQLCVALTPVGGHLRSVAMCECGFMPLTGVMASADRRQPVPGRPGVYLDAGSAAAAHAGLVAAALADPGPLADTGITASSLELFGSLRRWLSFREPAAALLSYVGPAAAADASGVPAVLEFPSRGDVIRSSPCLLGPAGFAVLDLAWPPADDPAGDCGSGPALALAVRGHGDAEPQVARLGELVTAWDAAGRPPAARLSIDAYPSGTPLPAAGADVCQATHTTFVITSA
jgi:protein-L-isoaspartate(D-aspartate) O-methyltransferase